MATEIEILYVPKDKSFVDLLFRGITLSFRLKGKQPFCFGRSSEDSFYNSRTTWVPPKIFAEARKRAATILKS